MRRMKRLGAGCWLWALPLLAIGAESPETGGGGLGVSELNQFTLILMAVVAIVVIVLWLMRRQSGGGSSVAAQMRVLGGVAVGNRERVVLMQVGETQILLGVSPGRVHKLYVLEQPLEVPKRPAAGASRQSNEGVRRLLRRRANAAGG